MPRSKLYLVLDPWGFDDSRQPIAGQEYEANSWFDLIEVLNGLYGVRFTIDKRDGWGPRAKALNYGPEISPEALLAICLS